MTPIQTYVVWFSKSLAFSLGLRGDKELGLSEFGVAVLAAVAYHQPIIRDGLRDIFGKDISRDLIGRLHAREFITTCPRAPRRGAPYTFVTTDQFLVAFDLESLRDLPDRELLEDAGITGAGEAHAGQA